MLASYTLTGNVEYLNGASASAQTLTGNDLNNAIMGTNAVNTLNGGAGNDILIGYGGNDTINGGTGDDRIHGRADNDTLTGDLGNDTFIFNTALNATTNVDHITDFSNVAGNNDIFNVDDAIFTALTAGALAGTAFVANATGTAADGPGAAANAAAIPHSRCQGSGK